MRDIPNIFVPVMTIFIHEYHQGILGYKSREDELGTTRDGHENGVINHR